jgi:aminomethyltransferase
MPESSDIHRTPLYEVHLQLGGKMTDFAGWILPLWYPTGQTAEHIATRNACGLFDICHMGEFRIEGPGAKPFLSGMLTNRVEQQADGQAMYHFMLNEAGGVIDDCILYRFDEEKFMLVVNAANADEDYRWLSGHVPDRNVRFEDISGITAKLDLQGPSAPTLMSKWISREILAGLKFFRFLPGIQIAGMDVLVSRTGYTGEIGFELYTRVENAVNLWNLLLTEGGSLGILPCGLAARDTLRIEAGLPLHGHELRSDWVAVGHPWEFAVHLEGSFIGKQAILKTKQEGIRHRVYAFSMKGKRKAMPGWEVFNSGKTAGTVLSAVISPSLHNTPIGFIETNRPLEVGTQMAFKQPGSAVLLEGEISAIPFVPLSSRRKMEEFLN